MSFSTQSRSHCQLLRSGHTSIFDMAPLFPWHVKVNFRSSLIIIERYSFHKFALPLRLNASGLVYFLQFPDLKFRCVTKSDLSYSVLHDRNSKVLKIARQSLLQYQQNANNQKACVVFRNTKITHVIKSAKLFSVKHQNMLHN